MIKRKPCNHLGCGAFVLRGPDLLPASGPLPLAPIAQPEYLFLTILLIGAVRLIVVQCKRYSDPVGPAAAQELLGSMVHHGADHATLASTGGFTLGVRPFIAGKQMSLMTLSDIVGVLRTWAWAAANKPIFYSHSDCA